jgi:hypothetical protein
MRGDLSLGFPQEMADEARRGPVGPQRSEMGRRADDGRKVGRSDAAVRRAKREG